jgi:superfamily I DNA/RNA helicase
MKEKIEDIAKKIQRHRDMEITIGATNNAVGRSFTLYNNEEQQFWLISKQATVVQFQRDIKGNIIPHTGYTENSTLKGDGCPVPRDSKLGGLLITNHEGKHKYLTPKGEIEIEIFDRATFKPSQLNGELATDILIKLAKDSKSYSYRTLVEILILEREIEEAKEQLDKATDEEAKLLLRKIAIKEEEKKSYLDKAQSFIRKYAELRYQPILDPIQESIKRSKIFDGALIINGGPGTGKTTSLIQRIKFLISPSIEEYTTLSKTQRDILYNQKTSWVFYSPNELLALFLRNSMKLEELIADADRVKVWAAHKNELVKTYRFVSETKRPFLIYNKSVGQNFFKNNADSVKSIIEGLNNAYLNFQKEKITKVLDLDITAFRWKNTGQSIQNFLKERSKLSSIDELIRLYLNLNEGYKNESDVIADDYTNLVKQIASRIQVQVQKEAGRKNTLAEHLKKWKTEVQETDEEDDDDTEIEQEEFDEKEELVAFDFEPELFIKLKSLCRKQALKKFDKNTKFSKRDKELLKFIPEVEQQENYEQLGQTAYFKKFFERITKGVVANVIREIPLIYKKYRREELDSKSKNWNLTVLEELVKKDKNSRIHADEQALLLYFTNGIASRLAKSFPNLFNNINHPYINGFKNNCKPVIGIDEATDFSLIDLVAINSFGHPELSSITLSGDLMQRMTFEGISSWDDFSRIVSNCDRKDLEVSYRQSPTLLSLAQAIYEKSTGEEANYKSYIERDEAEPKPLLLISKHEDRKLEWIASRIIEIYAAYGDSIPSIAIFLPEENQLEQFASKLGSLDTLADVGILVKACRNGEVLGDKNTVRVFSIKVIKGLEFESVFFHNIDGLQSQNLANDILLKYLYVALSRATFYLALSISNELNKDLAFITRYFDNSGKTWQL